MNWNKTVLKRKQVIQNKSARCHCRKSFSNISAVLPQDLMLNLEVKVTFYKLQALPVFLHRSDYFNGQQKGYRTTWLQRCYTVQRLQATWIVHRYLQHRFAPVRLPPRYRVCTHAHAHVHQQQECFAWFSRSQPWKPKRKLPCLLETALKGSNGDVVNLFPHNVLSKNPNRE